MNKLKVIRALDGKAFDASEEYYMMAAKGLESAMIKHAIEIDKLHRDYDKLVARASKDDVSISNELDKRIANIMQRVKNTIM